jgi:hypothetical protein
MFVTPAPATGTTTLLTFLIERARNFAVHACD